MTEAYTTEAALADLAAATDEIMSLGAEELAFKVDRARQKLLGYEWAPEDPAIAPCPTPGPTPGLYIVPHNMEPGVFMLLDLTKDGRWFHHPWQNWEKSDPGISAPEDYIGPISTTDLEG
jgi:hypothetical protein